jgi:N-methylhydantoinase B
VLLGALVQAIPERAAAASNGVTSLFNIGGVDPRTGSLYNYIETYAGGQGAMHSQDGMDAVQCHMTNTRNAPVEVIESAYPLFLHSYGLVPDSEGAGRFRGGLGMRREIRILSDKTVLTVSTDRTHLRPWGVDGGHDGGNSACTIAHRDADTEQLAYSKMTRSLEREDTVTISTPGAGGWGDPFTRDPRRVLWDVREEFISRDAAAERYGVVVLDIGNGDLAIDEAATDALRARHRNVPLEQPLSSTAEH